MMNWIVIKGDFDIGKQIIFKGGELVSQDIQGHEKTQDKYGLVINNQHFAGGEIKATVEFAKISANNACELLFYFNPSQNSFVSAGLGGPHYGYFIRHWDGKSSRYQTGTASKLNLHPKTRYDLTLKLRGSQVRLSVNEVDVLAATLPFPLPPSQTGISCLDSDDIKISNFTVSNTPGQAFVVMQFSSPFNEIYEEVIKNVCKEFGIEAHRGDETYGPGLIIADVTREIANSKFVIAEITPANPNVYYEIGYAHAINKPTILLAESNGQKLPFDISGFRVLFYENSIAGKRKFEEGLRRHISAIFEQSIGSVSTDFDGLPAGESTL
jgi:hypothetical protein